MRRAVDTIENYISMINTIVEKFNNNCDLKYDLILYLEINLKNGKFNDAINKENYIFICLKNEALKIYKKKYISDTISLNFPAFDDGPELIDMISYRKIEEVESINKNNIHMDELKFKICQICSELDFNLLYKSVVLRESQKKIANDTGISQQAISKKLIKIKKKLRDNLVV